MLINSPRRQVGLAGMGQGWMESDDWPVPTILRALAQVLRFWVRQDTPLRATAWGERVRQTPTPFLLFRHIGGPGSCYEIIRRHFLTHTALPQGDCRRGSAQRTAWHW